MFLGKLHDEPAFSGTDLEMKRVIVSEKRFPLAALFFRFLYNPGAGSDHIAGTRYIS
jgi:hypothetical protein